MDGTVLVTLTWLKTWIYNDSLSNHPGHTPDFYNSEGLTDWLIYVERWSTTWNMYQDAISIGEGDHAHINVKLSDHIQFLVPHNHIIQFGHQFYSGEPNFNVLMGFNINGVQVNDLIS